MKILPKPSFKQQNKPLTAMLCQAAVSGAGQIRLGAGLD